MVTGQWKELLVFAAVFSSAAAALFVIRKVAFGLLSRWARRTETTIDDILAASLRHPSVFWVLATAFYISIATSNFPQRYVDYGLKAIYAVIVLSITMALAGFTSRALQRSFEKYAIDVPVTGLSKAIVYVFILATGLIIILNSLNISIAPLLTALGVGGLAVALALQDTLSNIFAGVHILVERPFSVGDYIKIDGGEEGYVVDIGWRTTKIKKLQNNLVIVPNNKVIQSVLTNFHLPEKRMSLLIPVGVSYDTDPEKVERVLAEEALVAAGEIPGLLSDPPPFVRFIPGFGQFSLDFTLICQVGEFTDQYLVQHELRKRIFKRFKEEKIEIPFPVRTVHLKRE